MSSGARFFCNKQTNRRARSASRLQLVMGTESLLTPLKVKDLVPISLVHVTTRKSPPSDLPIQPVLG